MATTNLKQYDIDDPTFKADLKESIPYVWLAAHWFHAKGYDVTVPAVKVRDKVENMRAFRDGGDLYLNGKHRIEIKRRPDINFTSKKNFPYRTIIVDVAHCWDEADPKPEAYLIFNKSASHAFVVRGKTCEYWKKLEKWDTKKKRNRWFYECSLEHVEIRDMR